MNNFIFFSFHNLTGKSVFFDNIVFFIAEPFSFFVLVFALFFTLFHHDVLTSKNSFLILKQKWKEIILVFFISIFAWFLSVFLKNIFLFERPFFIFENLKPLWKESGYAFPSGHATAFMALAFAIFFSHKKMGLIFIFFALLISMARIIAGIHFPIDILGGFILGILTAYFVKFIYKKINF